MRASRSRPRFARRFSAVSFGNGFLRLACACFGVTAVPAFAAGTSDMPSMGAMPAMPSMPSMPTVSPKQSMPSMPAMQGMDMDDNGIQHQFMVDQLEGLLGKGAHGLGWQAQGWVGRDFDKLVVRSEGEHFGGNTEDARVEALWSHAVSTYWDAQLGVRHDFGTGPNREWAAVGVSGTAPWWLSLQSAVYVGGAGRTALWVRGERDWRLTQRWVLTPEVEVNAYGRADRAREIGSGLSDTTVGLRLRYEVSPKFAPYIGLSWDKRFAGTAGLVRQAGQASVDRELVAGVRFWF